MADTLLQSAMGFGIKEVCDVAFYNVGDVTEDGGVLNITSDPLFILDTLKVSNIENTAEQSDAKGGKGNAPLLTWDYGREITVSLQDAVLSEKTLSLMFEGDAAGTNNVIEINANKYPGVYAVVGKTFARDMDGTDKVFTWFVPRAKVNSEVTLTMEAEGDPTVFDMNLKVLRTSDGTMMKLIRETTVASDYNVETAFKASSTVTYSTYMFKVTDDSAAVAGAVVSYAGLKTTTDASGIAVLSNVDTSKAKGNAVASKGGKSGSISTVNANEVNSITLA